MELNTALNLKSAMSENFFSKKTNTGGHVITFAMAASPAATAMAAAMKQMVNGIGIAEKQNGESVVKVLTKTASALNRAAISRHFGVKADDILIQETGLIRLRLPTSNHRPPYPGISVGHYRVTAGTLGCFVQDENNKRYILSNNHVLANTNRGKYGDPVLQPGRLDGGRTGLDKIARLSYLVPIEMTRSNQMDAAIAEIEQGLTPVFPINNQHKISGTTEPANRMKVEKFGRTTGHTKGRITTRNLDLKVDFDGQEVEFQDQFEIKAGNGKMFCDGGDSGSLIFESGTLKAVGLLFAGADDGTTFATPISGVLDAFNAKIL